MIRSAKSFAKPKSKYSPQNLDAGEGIKKMQSFFSSPDRFGAESQAVHSPASFSLSSKPQHMISPKDQEQDPDEESDFTEESKEHDGAYADDDID